jgi:hypothetical protein
MNNDVQEVFCRICRIKIDDDVELEVGPEAEGPGIERAHSPVLYIVVV